MNSVQGQQKNSPPLLPMLLLPGGKRHLLSLPDELLVQIVSYLPPHSTITLHSTCRRLRGLTRQDPALWRSLCAYQVALDTRPSFAAPTPPPSPPTMGIAAAAVAQTHTSAAAWPTPGIDDTEKIDWYNEYKFRHAPLKMRWFCAGTDRADVEVGIQDEVKGLSVFSSASGGAAGGGENDMLLSSLSDGSICIWSLKDTVAGRGRRVVARSRPGLVFSDHGDEKWRIRRKARDAEIVDGVSVDDVTGKIWVAAEEGLIEIDLNTLQKVSTHRFQFSIQTLSQTSHPHPLTVGTTNTLHLHDPRVSVPASTMILNDDYSSMPLSVDERVESQLRPSHPFRANYYSHAALFQPGPLAILHSDPPYARSGGDGEIYVAGRFPSILCYERRMWPKLRRTIHSGGRLCALAKIPACSFSSSPASPASPSELPTTSDWDHAQQPEEEGGERIQVTLLASGEYNGRGTLEIYPLRATPSSSRTSPSLPTSTSPVATNATMNRQTASRSKLLTLASHGARIVTGDADGVVKWVERDGRTTVRAYLIEAPEKKRHDSAGLWGSGDSRTVDATRRLSGHSPAGGEAVRKVIVAKEGGEELVVWAGDRVGVLGGFGDTEVEEEEEKEDLDEEEMEMYLERMREVLRGQATEVRIMAGLGMGGL